MEQSFKEILLNELWKSNNDLPAEILVWASSHLPDTNNEGTFTKNINNKYNHNSSSFLEAIGEDENFLEKANEQISNIVADGVILGKSSKVYELLINNPIVIKYITIMYCKYLISKYIQYNKEYDNEPILNFNEKNNDKDTLSAHTNFTKFLIKVVEK